MPVAQRIKTHFPGVYYIEKIEIKSGKTDRIFYIRYRKNRKQYEEKVGSKLLDTMTAARAADIRQEKTGKKRISDGSAGQPDKLEPEPHNDLWTINLLWEKYSTKQRNKRSFASDNSRYTKFIKIAFGNRALASLTPAELKKFRNNLLKTKSPQTVKHILALVNRLHNFSIRNNLGPGLSFAIDMPKVENKPTDLHDVYRIRTIKKCMAYSLGMHELQNYGFFDEDFLRQIKWEPGTTVSVQNPVSENWRRLATTLVPNMLHAIDNNQVDQDQLRFFEWGRTWTYPKKIKEHKTLTGIFYDKHTDVNFYDAKALLSILFDRLRLPVSWIQVDKPEYPWFMPYQTADILYNKTRIGTAGKVNKSFLHSLCPGDAFIFELDGDFLVDYKAEPLHFVPSSKYPAVERDVSMLVPLSVTVSQITKDITAVDKTIVNVSLIDFFEKPEWKDQKSITMRFVLQDYTKTLTKPEADAIYDKVTKAMKKLGAEIR